MLKKFLIRSIIRLLKVKLWFIACSAKFSITLTEQADIPVKGIFVFEYPIVE